MAGFLIAEEGPLGGLVVRMEEGDEWIIGRDPDVCFQVVEDPMVSRKHAIFHLTPEGHQIENLSAVNPASVNGTPLELPIQLKEGDAVQIGNILFRYTQTDPAAHPSAQEVEAIEENTPTIYEESEEADALAFAGIADTRWIIKVISGPNAGAEFGLHQGTSYVIGKDPNLCDIIFQDLSVSRRHAEIAVNAESKVHIEDLNSRNKVLVNGLEIMQKTELNTQDLVALGTTSFLLIDKEQTRETIVSPTGSLDYTAPSQQEQAAEEMEVRRDWKKLTIPTRHFVIAGLFVLLLIAGIGGVLSLFKSRPIVVSNLDESGEVSQALKNFPEVGFSFNASVGKIFLLGHVMTEVDHQEMVYLLKGLPFVSSIDDNVVIDELVWENTNALLSKNPNWRSVSLTSMMPGRFVLRGYVQTLDQSTQLSNYINLNFLYLDKLDNQVIVANTLEAQIQGALLGKELFNVTFQFSNGTVLLSGRVGEHQVSDFDQSIEQLKKIKGVRLVKNFVVTAKTESDVIDISAKYKVTGHSKVGNVTQYVVIGGKILSKGDFLDGMQLSQIEGNVIFLKKDGIKYRINYNQQ